MEKNIKKFFELRDKYWNAGDGKSVVFIKHILVYFYEYRNILETAETTIVIPGIYDLVTADNILHELGYRKYSINYVSPGIYKCKSTKITFRNTL